MRAKNMKSYEVIVVGAGDVGLAVAFRAASAGLKVALIEKGNVGGTCVNNGCVPSKMLTYAADRIMETRRNATLGIRSEMADPDFRTIMSRMRRTVENGRNSIIKALEESKEIDVIAAEGHFTGERTLEAGGRMMRGRKIFISSGARPSIPPIKGLDTIRHLTSESLLELEERPGRMIVIGGGYIGLEYAHFFSAMGTDVIVVDRNTTLLHFEEPEISALLKKELEKRIDLRMGVETSEVRHDDRGYAVTVKEIGTGRDIEIVADALMVATGRRSNADLLRVEEAGIETDGAHFIKVDEFLQTNKRHVWALGDAIGRAMFTHAGDKEAELAWHNATHRKKLGMDFGAVPHAVYTWPQIASVGLTEALARNEYDILVGRANYADTVMGEAMGETEGFAKAVADKKTGRILGFHIIGPHAAMLIQEVVNAVAHGDKTESVTGCMHIFPALSNLIPETLGNLQ